MNKHYPLFSGLLRFLQGFENFLSDSLHDFPIGKFRFCGTVKIDFVRFRLQPSVLDPGTFPFFEGHYLVLRFFGVDW
jgi:hypothetical protein